MPAMTPAEGFQQMVADFLEKTHLEGNLAATHRLLVDISTTQLTKDERDMLALARASVFDLAQSVRARHAQRAHEVVKAEQRALTRKCEIPGMHAHYWIDEPGRDPRGHVRAADKYEFAIARVCPQHESKRFG